MNGLIAKQMKSAGRFGDTELVHINPQEKAALDSLTPGGKPTIKPETGLPEYFSLKKIVKGAVKGVKSVVKGAMKGDIGSIAMLAAAVYTGGAALGAWGAGTVAAGGAGSAFAAGGQGFWSTVGSNLSNMASSAFGSLSGTAASAGGYGPTLTELGAPAAGNGFGLAGSLSKVGSVISNNRDAFKIAGKVGSALLLAQGQQASADTSLEIAKNQKRWDNEAIAENYADSGYYQQDLGVSAPNYTRELKRTNDMPYGARRSGLVSSRIREQSQQVGASA